MSQPVNNPIVHAPELDRPTEAEELFNELMTQLDDVYGIVCDGPEVSDDQIPLLAKLPTADLERMASYSEEYAENVRDYARLAREALAYRAENVTEGDGDERENEGDDADGDG